MKLLKILDEMQIKYKCESDCDFDSLGLAGYNNGNNVCTFVDNEKYLKEISTNISLIITNEKIAEHFKGKETSFEYCIVENPRITFFKVHNYLTNSIEYRREYFCTKIGENCNISRSAFIAENNVIIGDNVTIEEFTVIRENTIIGDNSIIRAGCKIGGDGFEFKNTGSEVFRVKHIGGVVVGKEVEIQYNSCVDKAIYPWDNTIIGNYCKIDNLVHIGHAVKIGDRTMVVANSGIGGRVAIGNDSWIGFGATLRNGINVGNNSRANMGSVVTQSIDDNQAVTGNFAINHDMFIQKIKIEGED